MAKSLEERNLAAVEALFAATGSGDWAKAESMLTDDFFVTEADTLPFAGVYRGKKALQEIFQIVIPATGVKNFDIKQMTAGGNNVVVLLALVLEGPPEVRVPLAEVFTFRDGKVCEIKPYYFDPRPMVVAFERLKKR